MFDHDARRVCADGFWLSVAVRVPILAAVVLSAMCATAETKACSKNDGAAQGEFRGRSDLDEKIKKFVLSISKASDVSTRKFAGMLKVVRIDAVTFLGQDRLGHEYAVVDRSDIKGLSIAPSRKKHSEEAPCLFSALQFGRDLEANGFTAAHYPPSNYLPDATYKKANVWVEVHIVRRGNLSCPESILIAYME